MATESLIVELDAETKKLDSKLKATDKQINKLDDSVKKTDVSFSKMSSAMVIGATAAAAAITTMTNSAVRFARELEVAATRANTTVEEMQALAFASGTVGISLEKLGDISKDTNEKIGEFIATGGGGFVDFIDVMKLSSAEANVLAREFQNMSGPQVLQAMTKQMEDAGISGNQMSFALEGLASDATDLIPLLKDNASELNRLKNEFSELGTVLNQEQIDSIKRVGEEFSKLGETFGAEGRQLIADYSDEIIKAIEVIKTLATTTTDVLNIISTGWGNIIELSRAALNDLINGTDTFNEALIERTEQSQEAIDRLLGKNQKAMEIVITGGTDVVKKTTKEEKTSLDQRLKNFQNYSKAAAVVNAAFLEDNKAIKAGLIVADTAAAVMLQLSSGDPFTAFSRAALAGAIGAAQLANALSSSKGGGTISEGGGGSVTSTEPAQQSFEQETTTQEASVSVVGDEASTDVTNLTFNAEGGSSADEFMAMAYNDAVRSGRITTGGQR